jgi:hypothetical protein
MSRGGKLAKNTIVLAIGTFLPKLATFITLPILTGSLTKESYGTYDLIVVLVSLFLPAVTLQIQTAAFRFLIDIRDKKEKVKSIVTNITAFIVPVSIIALLILYFCLYKIDFEVRILICLYYFLDIFGNSLRQIVRGLSENLKYSLSAIINSLAQLIFVVVFVWYFEIGLLGGVLALAVAELISALYLFFSAKIYKFLDFKIISIKEIKRMLAYSWPMVPNSMSMWVMRVSDRLVITFFMNVSANAVYAVANKIPQLLTLAQTTFTMAWQENASIVSKDEDADRYYSDMYKTMFDLMAGAMCMIIAFVPLLFIILVRGDYSEAYNQIPILLIGMVFYAMSAYLGGIYVAYMKTKSVGITTIVAAVLNVIIDIALINFIGLYAASLSTLISYVFLFFYRLIDVRKIVKIKYDLKHMFLVFAFMAIVSILCMLQNSIVNIVNFVLAAVLFVALNRQFLTLIFKMIKKKVAKK